METSHYLSVSILSHGLLDPLSNCPLTQGEVANCLEIKTECPPVLVLQYFGNVQRIPLPELQKNDEPRRIAGRHPSCWFQQSSELIPLREILKIFSGQAMLRNCKAGFGMSWSKNKGPPNISVFKQLPYFNLLWPTDFFFFFFNKNLNDTGFSEKKRWRELEWIFLTSHRLKSGSWSKNFFLYFSTFSTTIFHFHFDRLDNWGVAWSLLRRFKCSSWPPIHCCLAVGNFRLVTNRSSC